MRSDYFAAAFVCAVAMLNTRSADAGGYSYTELYTLTAPATYAPGDFLPSGGASTMAVGGQIAGYGTLQAGVNTLNAQIHALIWNGTSPVDLNPSSGYTHSFALGTNGSFQVGDGYGTVTGNAQNALMWNGSAASAVNLNPTIPANGYTSSSALDTDGSQQVGFASGPSSGNNHHAFLWTGSGSSAVDLNPSGFTSSTALGVSGVNGNFQVGYGVATASGNQHALAWSGNAGSAVDLNPSTGFTTSEAVADYGNQQVGDGSGNATGNDPNALLWNGTAASAVDLNPGGFEFSFATATNGSLQVGYGASSASGGEDQAILWSGNSLTYTNLGALLPSSTFVSSQAFAIDAAGDVFGIAIDTSGNYDAIEWQVGTPEPTGPALLLIAGLGALARRRRRRI